MGPRPNTEHEVVHTGTAPSLVILPCCSTDEASTVRAQGSTDLLTATRQVLDLGPVWGLTGSNEPYNPDFVSFEEKRTYSS